MLVELSEAADEDLTGIHAYSSDRFGIAQADRYLLGIQSCLARIAYAPGLARVVKVNASAYRRYEHGRHTIFFREIEGGIRVIRVLHARMDPARHLSPPP